MSAIVCRNLCFPTFTLKEKSNTCILLIVYSVIGSIERNLNTQYLHLTVVFCVLLVEVLPFLFPSLFAGDFVPELVD